VGFTLMRRYVKRRKWRFIMERSLLVGGFGGQGVMVTGQLLCYTATETTDKFVTYFPSYGAEQRGGTANCYVTISDKKIGAPMADMMDDLIALNNPSLNRFISRVKPNGAVFVNNSIVTDEVKRDDVTVVKVPASEIAHDLGDTRVANLVMIGAYIGYSDLLPPEKVKYTAEKKLGAKRPHLIPLNNAAFEKGMEYGKAAKEGGCKTCCKK